MAKVLLELERPVAFYPQLARALGGIEEAIFVQQLYYWSDKTKRKDGYIFKKKSEWEEETTISRYVLDRIIKKLKRKKIIDVKLYRANGVPTLHYKLNTYNLSQILRKASLPIIGNADNRETNVSISGKPANHEKRVYPHSVTETTTETTTDISPLTPLSGGMSKNETNIFINSFKHINPSYEILFNRKNQRDASSRLIKKYTLKKCLSLMHNLPLLMQQKYAPQITTPLELEQKLAKLLIFIKRRKYQPRIVSIK